MDLEVGMLVGSAAQMEGSTPICGQNWRLGSVKFKNLHICGVQLVILHAGTSDRQQCYGCWRLQILVLRFPTDNRVGGREQLPFGKVSRTARCRAKTLVGRESRKVCCLCVAAAFC